MCYTQVMPHNTQPKCLSITASTLKIRESLNDILRSLKSLEKEYVTLVIEKSELERKYSKYSKSKLAKEKLAKKVEVLEKKRHTHQDNYHACYKKYKILLSKIEIEVESRS